MIEAANLALWVLVAIAGFFAWRRRGRPALVEAGRSAAKMGWDLLPRILLGLTAAMFFAKLLPAEWIVKSVGGESGIAGILLASVAGGLLPGGPMTSFPIALFLWQLGAGVPQMVALLVGWSVFAFHRVLAYEIPMMGWRFALLRFVSTLAAPPLAALLAMGALALMGDPQSFGPPAR